MAVKDWDKNYDGLRAPDAVVQTPNAVSRSPRVGDRSFQNVVFQSGRPILDSELQLGQDAGQWDNALVRKWQSPSGWFRGQTRSDSYCDFFTEKAPPEVVDDIPHGDSLGSIGESIGAADSGILQDRTMVNCFILPRLEAMVAGKPVVVEYTNTRTSGYNLIPIFAPTFFDGSPESVKRTDFVFLEVWYALVAPSPKARGFVQVASINDLQAGDTITLDGMVLTAAAAPAPNSFVIVAGDYAATAANIANAINDPANPYSVLVVARAFNDIVQIEAFLSGAGGVGVGPFGHNTGNNITLSVTTAVAGALVASGPFFVGGENRPNKPSGVNDQDMLFRHGNVESPAPVWLADELIDPVVDFETTQRVQLQYRIRVTDENAAINYKKHPDGFSNNIGGPTPTVFAQGARSTPASNVSGRFYPFVPSDRASIWGNSSAVAYDIEDDGLWVAGDGSEQSTKDLGSVDGFVYAIPIAFLFRHNDVSDRLVVFKGFDPVNNANGAPTYQHVGYTGPVGPIPAGKSDRPDGEFCDVITQNSILDLRRHIILPGVDFASEVQYQIQSLLDGSTRTWQVDTASKQELGHLSGDVSTRYLICNEVGRESGPFHEGNDVTTGNTHRGVTVRNFDHVARRFGDQSVVERVVFAFYPGDRAVGPVVAPGTVNPGKFTEKLSVPDNRWMLGDVLHLDLAQLNATTLGGIFQGLDGGGPSGIGLAHPFVADYAPPGTVITDVLSIYHDDGDYNSVGPAPQDVIPSVITGLGTTHLTIKLDRNDFFVSGGLPTPPNPTYHMVGTPASPDGSPRRIFVEVEITYPLGDGNRGTGTTDTPTLLLDPDPAVYSGDPLGTGAGPGPILENDITQRPNDFEGLLQPKFREGFREIQLEYVANDTVTLNPMDHHPEVPVGAITPETLVSRDTHTLYFPRRLFGASGGSIGSIGGSEVTVSDISSGAPIVKTVDEALTEFGNSSRKVVLENITPLPRPQTLCAITYFPQDPIPNYGMLGFGYQVSVYFRANAPQTAGVKEGDIRTDGDGVLPSLLRVEPLIMGASEWTGQRGVGSVEEAFPYAVPLDQIPILCGTPLDKQEWYFCATASTTVDDFNASTGLLALHPFVQGDIQNILEFGGPDENMKPIKDAEFKAMYPFANPDLYRPTIMSQPLYGATRHKVFVPILVRAIEDVPGVEGGLLYRKNELLLVVLSRFAELDDDNTVRFIDPPSENRTCAALYRTRNLLIVVGGRICPPPPPPLSIGGP